MVTDAREPKRGYPIPAEGNTIAEDFARLILALTAIAIDVAGLLQAVAAKADADHQHQIADITGLVAALIDKADADHTHALGGLSDVETAGAAIYQVLAKATDGKWRPWTIDLANVIGAAAYARLDGASFTTSPKVPTTAITADSSNTANVTMVRAAVAALKDQLINGAGSALDTLYELAAALGDDPNFATTITTALAAKAPLASPALTGNPTATTQTAKNSSTRLATTAFVQTDKGYRRGITTLTASTTLTSSHLGNLIVCNATNAFTLTLPSAGAVLWGVLSLVNIGTTSAVTLSGSIVYDGATVTSLTVPPGASLDLVSDGTSWVVTQQTLPTLTVAEWLAGSGTIDGPISPATLASVIAAKAPKIISAAPITLTGQTTALFSGIPADAKRLTVQFAGLSNSVETSNYVQLGVAGALVTTGYVSGASYLGAGVGGGGGAAGNGTGFLATIGFPASEKTYGNVELTRCGNTNTWVSSHVLSRNGDARVMAGGGIVTLSGAADRLAVAALSGTFDDGSVALLVE